MQVAMHWCREGQQLQLGTKLQNAAHVMRRCSDQGAFASLQWWPQCSACHCSPEAATAATDCRETKTNAFAESRLNPVCSPEAATAAPKVRVRKSQTAVRRVRLDSSAAGRPATAAGTMTLRGERGSCGACVVLAQKSTRKRQQRDATHKGAFHSPTNSQRHPVSSRPREHLLEAAGGRQDGLGGKGNKASDTQP